MDQVYTIQSRSDIKQTFDLASECGGQRKRSDTNQPISE